MRLRIGRLFLHHDAELEPWKLGRRPALDGLRGVAILLVMIAHAYVPGFAGGGAAGGVRGSRRLARAGPGVLRRGFVPAAPGSGRAPVCRGAVACPRRIPVSPAPGRVAPADAGVTLPLAAEIPRPFPDSDWQSFG